MDSAKASEPTKYSTKIHRRPFFSLSSFLSECCFFLTNGTSGIFVAFFGLNLSWNSLVKVGQGELVFCTVWGQTGDRLRVVHNSQNIFHVCLPTSLVLTGPVDVRSLEPTNQTHSESTMSDDPVLNFIIDEFFISFCLENSSLIPDSDFEEESRARDSLEAVDPQGRLASMEPCVGVRVHCVRACACASVASPHTGAMAVGSLSGAVVSRADQVFCVQGVAVGPFVFVSTIQGQSPFRSLRSSRNWDAAYFPSASICSFSNILAVAQNVPGFIFFARKDKQPAGLGS